MFFYFTHFLKILALLDLWIEKYGRRAYHCRSFHILSHTTARNGKFGIFSVLVVLDTSSWDTVKISITWTFTKVLVKIRHSDVIWRLFVLKLIRKTVQSVSVVSLLETAQYLWTYGTGKFGTWPLVTFVPLPQNMISTSWIDTKSLRLLDIYGTDVEFPGPILPSILGSPIVSPSTFFLYIWINGIS